VAGSSLATNTLAALGGELDTALEELDVPAFIIGKDGVIRWENGALRSAVGDFVGRPYFEVVAPDSRAAARLSFTKKMLGTERASHTRRWLLTRNGEHVEAELHTVAVAGSDQMVVGVFGIAAIPKGPPARHRASRQGLTPRQQEVLEGLARGSSTDQIAAALSIEPVTVRNHVRGILRTLGVHSRLEAVLEASRRGLLNV
jgi:DNA-binding CsgD family transcriptional regulator